MTDSQPSNECKAFLDSTPKSRRKQIRDAELPKLLQIFTQIQQKSATSKNSSINYLQDLTYFGKTRKSDLQNEDFNKIVLKTLIDLGGKSRIYSKSVFGKLTKLATSMSQSSELFVKFLKQILRKLDFPTFNKTVEFLSEIENKDVLQEINERMKVETENIKVHKQPWSKHLFQLLGKTDGLRNVLFQMRDSLRNSVATVRNLQEVFSELDLTLISDRKVFDDLFDVSFNECFGKEEGLTLSLLEFAGRVLRNNDSLIAKSKAEGLLIFLNQRISKTQSPEVQTAFASLIANLAFNFDKKVQGEILCNFVEMFGNLKSAVDKNSIVESLRLNKSLAQATGLPYILERKKHLEFPTAVFALARFIGDSAEYSLLLRDFYAKNCKGKTLFSNFRNYIFAFSEEIGNGSFDEQTQTDFLKRVVGKDDYLSKPTVFESILKVEAEAIIKIIAHVSDETLSQVGFNENEKHSYGVFVINALSCYFKSWHKLSILLPKKTAKQIVKSLFIILTQEAKSKTQTEKYSEIVKYVLCENGFQPKNKTTVFKVLGIISQADLITPNDFKSLRSAKFFKIQVEGPVPEVFYRLFSRENILADQCDKTWLNLFVNLMFFYPELLQQSMFFFAKRNLIYLLSMWHLCESVDSLKSFNKNFFLEKEELEMLGLKEKAAPAKTKKTVSKEETFDDVKFISEATSFDAEIKQNEDEKFDELKLENNKAEVLQKYGLILNRLNQVYTSFFAQYSPIFQPSHLQIIENQLHLFRDSFKTVAYFSELLNGQYSCFLRHSSHNSSPDFTHLLEYNFGVVRGNDSPQFVRNLEFFIRTSDLNKIHVTKEVFGIMFEILGFVFENKIDTEYKRKLFYVVYNSLKEYPDLEKQFIQFICRNFNELNFEEAFESFRNILLRLRTSDPTIIDFALNDILKYEDFVVHYLLRTLHDIGSRENMSTQKVTVLQLLKILILTESEDEETAKLAHELVEVNTIFKFGASMVEGLSFRTIIEEFPTDLHGTIARILTKVCQSLEGSQQTIFMKTLIEQTRILVVESKYPDDEEKHAWEQRYQLFAKILYGLVTHLSESMLFSVFDYIFGKLNRDRTPGSG